MRHRSGIEIKSDDQLCQMRVAGLAVSRILAAVREAAAPGVTTAELDQLARGLISDAGATSSFLGYGGGYDTQPFPAVTCISVNSEIVHGIPGDRELMTGDLVSVDFGLSIAGWHGDSAITFGVGSLSESAQELGDVTREAMWSGVAAARIGGRVGDIAAAIERSIRAAGSRFGIVAEYTGHGIGSAMHQPPDVPNLGRAGRGPLLTKGMALAIEPMVTLGSAQTAVLEDDWTVVTRDASLAAHWEHTVALTSRGLWVLTAEDGGETELTRRGAPFGPLAD